MWTNSKPCTGKWPRSAVSRLGFTLVELLAVMVLIALLTGLVARISSSAHKTAAEARAHADIEKLKNALEEYRLEEGVYPPRLIPDPEEMDISAVTNTLRNLDGAAAVDPWGREYKYDKNGLHYTLYSQGPSINEDVDDVR